MEATRIQLCGRIAIEIAGRRLEEKLPGRQGTLLFAYLTAKRIRPTTRAELVAVLWPDQPPPRTADTTLAGASAHRLLMRALEAQGNVAAALAVYDQLRCLLRDELGTAPGAQTQALHKQLLA